MRGMATFRSRGGLAGPRRAGCCALSLRATTFDPPGLGMFPSIRLNVRHTCHMSVAGSIFNIAALIFSFVAILISAASARRQTVESRRSNMMSFMTELGQRTRSPEFRNAYDYILTDLSKFDPALGIYALPEAERSQVTLVGGFYQDLGTLVVTGVLDEDLGTTMYYTSIKTMWHALEPFIHGERNLRRSRGVGGSYTNFEHLAVYADSMSPEDVGRKFHRRSFPVFPDNPDRAASSLPTAQGTDKPQASEGS